MLTTVHAMSTGAQALTYFLALLLFLAAALIVWLQTPRAYWALCVSLGLACFALVGFWTNAVA